VIDLEQVQETFAASVDGTVGIEEEFAILDPETLDLSPRFEELSEAAQATDPALADSIAGELIASEIEIRSGRGDDLDDAFARQREARAGLFGLAAARGVALGATGTHPWADYREQRNIDTEHYRRVVDELQYAARRNNTFALHVHVGVRDIDRAVAVCDRLRPVLPLLLALSANSPYLDGVDAGLHSARTQAFTRTFPRCGIPDAYGSWSALREYVELLGRVGSIVESTQLWWSVRPAFAFGTVEVRICDMQSTAAESEALTALIAACVAQAARDVDDGVPHVDRPMRMLEENLWRAIRYGMDGQLIDLERGVQEPAARSIERLLEWTEPVRGELGITPEIASRNGAQRQREAIISGLEPSEVYAAGVRETLGSYATEVPTT
jgi:carboxylate-amine ligase